MPKQAFGERKYRAGTSVSKMADNEHTLTSLGQSEPLSVKAPVAPHIPEFRQPAKDGGKVVSSVRGTKAGDVFDNNPLWPKLSNNAVELEPEA